MGLISLLFGAGSRSHSTAAPSSHATQFRFRTEDIVTLIEPAGGATVSDHIIVEGHPVGHMVRRTPRNSSDTGWTFISGLESREYLADKDHWKCCDLNTVANLDRTVIPYLSWPEGTRLDRIRGTADFRPFAAGNPTQAEDMNAGDFRPPSGQHGWHTVFVNPDEHGAGFGFTVGLVHSYGHPEIFISGLSHEATHLLMRSALDSITVGQSFHTGYIAHDVANHPCAFVEVPKEAYEEFLGYALWYYRGRPFPVLQLVWPDPAGNFPWDSDYDTHHEQLVLGTRAV